MYSSRFVLIDSVKVWCRDVICVGFVLLLLMLNPSNCQQPNNTEILLRRHDDPPGSRFTQPFLCNKGYSYRIGDLLHRSGQLDTTLYDDTDYTLASPHHTDYSRIKIVSKSCISKNSRSSIDDICRVQSTHRPNLNFGEHYIVCLTQHNRRIDTDYDEDGCYYEKSKNFNTAPDCFVCCPGPKRYHSHDPTHYISFEYLVKTLDFFHKILWSATNTVLLYDSYISPVPGVALNLTNAIKTKHELYYVLRTVYELKLIHGHGDSINIDNKHAFKQWVKLLRGSMILANLKLRWANDQYKTKELENIRQAIKLALFPVRGVLCAMNLVALVENVKMDKVDLLHTYRVITSCLLTAKSWYDYVTVNSFNPARSKYIGYTGELKYTGFDQYIKYL